MTDEDREDLETALRAAEAGNAGHWPTVAAVLRDEVVRLRAQRDLLAWLHAESAWWLSLYQRDVCVVWKPERDELQARIDAADVELDNHDSKCNCEVEIVNRVRTALQGEGEPT